MSRGLARALARQGANPPPTPLPDELHPHPVSRPRARRIDFHAFYPRLRGGVKVHAIVMRNRDVIDAEVKHERDFAFDYFGFKVTSSPQTAAVKSATSTSNRQPLSVNIVLYYNSIITTPRPPQTLAPIKTNSRFVGCSGSCKIEPRCLFSVANRGTYVRSLICVSMCVRIC